MLYSQALFDYLTLEAELIEGRKAGKGEEFEDEIGEEMDYAYSLLTLRDREFLRTRAAERVAKTSEI